MSLLTSEVPFLSLCPLRRECPCWAGVPGQLPHPSQPPSGGVDRGHRTLRSSQTGGCHPGLGWNAPGAPRGPHRSQPPGKPSSFSTQLTHVATTSRTWETRPAQVHTAQTQGPGRGVTAARAPPLPGAHLTPGAGRVLAPAPWSPPEPGLMPGGQRPAEKGPTAERVAGEEPAGRPSTALALKVRPHPERHSRPPAALGPHARLGRGLAAPSAQPGQALPQVTAAPGDEQGYTASARGQGWGGQARQGAARLDRMWTSAGGQEPSRRKGVLGLSTGTAPQGGTQQPRGVLRVAGRARAEPAVLILGQWGRGRRGVGRWQSGSWGWQGQAAGREPGPREGRGTGQG